MNEFRADNISPLDMFKIGIGPSSSHTVGPMIAALEFRNLISNSNIVKKIDQALSLKVELYGSLSATGKGHSTDGAIAAGLSGLHPSKAEIEAIWACLPQLNKNPQIKIDDLEVRFNPQDDIAWLQWTIDGHALPHPNIIRFLLFSGKDICLTQIIASVGGGFIEVIDQNATTFKSNKSKIGKTLHKKDHDIKLPYPYNTASEFIEQCLKNKMAPWQIVIANQTSLGMPENKLREKLALILQTMGNSIERGLKTEGILPGGLNVRRRAKNLYEQMQAGKTPQWASGDLRPSVYAIAVNEENAAGGRVVTAPTNGSSGIIPAVWRYFQEAQNLNEKTLENGLIVASVIGALVKVHASISGAEVGCQGEVGASCAMAAGGATAMLGGTPYQIEQAAEIGIEHHLGMTCDPIMGLVQVPCIERNAMGAVKAINAAALSLSSDGKHLISLDRALEVMKKTGLDMNKKYKETSTGGLALG